MTMNTLCSCVYNRQLSTVCVYVSGGAGAVAMVEVSHIFLSHYSAFDRLLFSIFVLDILNGDFLAGIRSTHFVRQSAARQTPCTIFGILIVVLFGAKGRHRRRRRIVSRVVWAE